MSGRITENNWSPEATLTWHPSPDQTVYLAYKTGFKSGGYQAALVNTGTRISDLDFNSERVKGFELGAKGQFLDRRLRLSLTGFAFNFSDLQVNAFDPQRVTFVVGNAGGLRQRGVELDGNYRASDSLTLRGAVTYVRNRFHDYVGQCYSYAFPAGSVRATAVPPPGCSFATTTSLALQQDNEGKAPARSPDWSGNAGFDYNVPVDNMTFTISGDAAYSGSYNASDTFSPAAVQNSFWRFNASLAVATDDDHWRLALIGRNLTNKYYLTYASDRTGGASVPGNLGEQRGVVARGREILLQLGYKF
ncbi:TonB-dependent receptor [Sphingobium sp. CR2-8]|uniref:TonB-dependent receptor domain-containing protein n=1 Tax=Sphingobium sp. CR2-8 TaxID=1306534 RepID=UPI002DBEA527|nr:TonB-dependent receptor [Sphingobium sp. CR2-8]MEC3911894.1 TonB-dependent receptor [Sphingobium sp. CR2-8]